MKAKLKVIKNWEFEEFELTGTSFKYSPTGCKGMVTAVQCINVEVYVAGRGYSQLGEIAKYRKKSLDQIIRYIGYLEQIQAPVEYFEMVRDLQKKVVDLSVKPKDLKQICFRLSTEL